MLVENTVGFGSEAQPRKAKAPVAFGMIDKLPIDPVQPWRTRRTEQRPMKAPMGRFPGVDTLNIV